MSQGPRCVGNALAKSLAESAQNRASGMPGIAAIASSAAVNGARGGNFDGGGPGGGGVRGGGMLLWTRDFCPLPASCAARGEICAMKNAATITSAAQPRIARRKLCLIVHHA